MPYCWKCGTELKEDTKFCTSVVLLLADASEERKNVNGENDPWFIVPSVAPKMRKML